MSDEVEVYWVANWSCPKCEEPTDSLEHELEDGKATIVCKEMVDKGGYELEECGHSYTVNAR